MSQLTMGERLKFLLSALDLKIGPFARTMGVSDTNIRNYLERGSKPGADFLENLVRKFDTINPAWLLTGEGEPFTNSPSSGHSTTANVTKNSGIVGTHGTQYNFSVPENFDSCKQQLALLNVENEGLRNQLNTLNQLLASKDTIIAGKDDLLAVLRGGLHRPN